MTTKTLSGIYAGTYDLTSPITTLSITASGYLGGGVTATGLGAYAIVNAGGVVGYTAAISLAGSGSIANNGTVQSTSTVTGANGILLANGGVVINGGGGHTSALIEGDYGLVIAGQSGTVTNAGTIASTGTAGVAVYLKAGGVITNGAGGATRAFIEGADGVAAGLSATLHNYGTIQSTGTTGIATYFKAGGVVVNGSGSNTTASIGAYAICVGIGGAAGTVTNFGSITATGTAAAAVYLADGGVVTNGSTADTQAVMSGGIGVFAKGQAATVTNFGVIRSLGGPSVPAGVYLKNGGTITNGGSTVTTALIDGRIGAVVEGEAGTINNFGTIGNVAGTIGAALTGGGVITNGAAADTTALILGSVGVLLQTTVATLQNFGTILGNPFGSTISDSGVVIAAGGRVTNGSTVDTTALIRGTVGVYASTIVATVTNFGTVSGSLAGAGFAAGGLIINGGATDTTALIQGKLGVEINIAAGTIINFGTIRGGQIGGGSLGAKGAELSVGGVITNGSSADTTALISGLEGVSLLAGGTVNNFGTILGNSTDASVGATLAAGGSVVNGSATDAAALISAYNGVLSGTGATITNFGTIRGTGGLAIALSDVTSRLNAEAGSTIVGVIYAGSGIVDATSGLNKASGINTSGKIVGLGTLSLNGAISTLNAGAVLSVAQIDVSGAPTIVDVNVTSLGDAKVWDQTGGVLSIASADKMTFSGTGDTFSGALTGAGSVVFAGGSDTLTGITLSIAHATITNATVTLAGAVANTVAITATTPHLIVAAGGAFLTGGGILTLTNLATNAITGVTAGSTLTNFNNRIQGAGKLGNGLMTLVNEAKGVISGDVSNALIINTGAATITNAGVIQSTSTGGVTISSAIDNTGALIAAKGNLTVNANVTGNGVVKINGATADFNGSFSENVIFTGSTGVLELAHSQAYAGKVTGLSLTGTSSLDLLDIGFTSGLTKASYVDNGSKTGGVLTATDGTHTAHITLVGDYSASTFTTSSDGHGGTRVVDPAKAAATSSPPLAQFAAHMASLESHAAASHPISHGAPALFHPLAAPSFHA